MHTDSSTIEKVHRICHRISHVTLLVPSQPSQDSIRAAYLSKREPTPPTEEQTDERRADQTPTQAPRRQFPTVLLLSRACVDAHHDPYDVGRAGNVEELEDEVPPTPPARKHLSAYLPIMTYVDCVLGL